MSQGQLECKQVWQIVNWWRGPESAKVIGQFRWNQSDRPEVLNEPNRRVHGKIQIYGRSGAIRREPRKQWNKHKTIHSSSPLHSFFALIIQSQSRQSDNIDSKFNEKRNVRQIVTADWVKVFQTTFQLLKTRAENIHVRFGPSPQTFPKNKWKKKIVKFCLN